MSRASLVRFGRLVLVTGVLLAAAAQTGRAQSPLDRLKRAADAAQKAAEAKKAADDAKAKERSSQPATPPVASQSQPVTLGDLEKSVPPAASVEMGVWKAMPDVVGVHLHMPLDAAIGQLKQEYAKARRFQPWTANPLPLNTPQKQFVTALTMESSNATFHQDNVDLRFTYPPNAQVVWNVTRAVANAPVSRATLLAAMREKYGKETVASTGSGDNDVITTDDRRIVDLVWLFDEQGRRVASPIRGTTNTLTSCERNDGAPGTQLEEASINNFESQTSCRHVGIWARLDGDPDIINGYRLESVNIPLFIRAAKTTLAWREAEMNRIREQEIDKSKQVTPKL